MSELVKLTRSGDIAVVTIDNPPVNALSPGVPEGIVQSIEAAAHDPAVKAMVVIGAGSTFIAGADIREFQKMTSVDKPRGTLLPTLTATANRTSRSRPGTPATLRSISAMETRRFKRRSISAPVPH